MFHISMMLTSKCIMHADLHDGADDVCGYNYYHEILVEFDGHDDVDYAPTTAPMEGDGDDDDDDDDDGDYAPAA